MNHSFSGFTSKPFVPIQFQHCQEKAFSLGIVQSEQDGIITKYLKKTLLLNFTVFWISRPKRPRITLFGFIKCFKVEATVKSSLNDWLYCIILMN